MCISSISIDMNQKEKKVHHKRRDRKMKKTMDLTKRNYQAGHEKVALLAPGFFREPLKWWLFKTHFLLAVGFGSLLLGWRTFSRLAAKKPSITDDSKASDKCESSSFVPGSTDSRWLTTLPKNQLNINHSWQQRQQKMQEPYNCPRKHRQRDGWQHYKRINGCFSSN